MDHVADYGRGIRAQGREGGWDECGMREMKEGGRVGRRGEGGGKKKKKLIRFFLIFFFFFGPPPPPPAFPIRAPLSVSRIQ